MVDPTDFWPSFAEIASVKLPANKTLDGHSLIAHGRGSAAEPRSWIFIHLGRQWYVREPEWKLNQAGELFDMRDAPFAEKLVAADAKDAAALAARERLGEALTRLNPAGGDSRRRRRHRPPLQSKKQSFATRHDFETAAFASN